MQHALEEFDLKFHLFANVVCDRGSNILKALRESNIEPVHCLAHRLDNILNRCFLSNSKSTKTNQQTTTHLTPEQNLLLSIDDENSCHSSDDENVPVKNYSIVSKTRKPKKKLVKAVQKQIGDDIDHIKIRSLSDFPAEVLLIVQTIKSIKSIVKYVKKVSNLISESLTCIYFLSLGTY
jgi:hypothetical protein